MDKCGLSKEFHGKILVSEVGYRYKESSSSLGNSLFILFELYAYHNTFECITVGIIHYVVGHGWLYLHRTKVECYDKVIECLDDNGEPRVLQGKKKATSVRMVTTMQAKRSRKKGCKLFAVHISSDKGKEV